MMMRFTAAVLSALFGLVLYISPVSAADYSALSTEELANMRGTLQNATEEERKAFQNEWQKRTQNMTQEERQKYLGKPEGAGQGAMMQNREMMQERMKERIQKRDMLPQRGNGMGSGRMGSGRGGGRR